MGGPRGATTSAPAAAPLLVSRGPAARYFPRDVFFCFFTFKLTIGAFAPVPRETGWGTGCFFDFPAMAILLGPRRVATDGPTVQALVGCAVLCVDRGLSPKRWGVQKEEYDDRTGPAARTLAETPKAVNVRLARETMEPRQTEFQCRASTLSPGTERR